MNQSFIISVIIPTYNRSRLLSYTLISLARQTISNEFFEVIVVDDGSTDNSQDLVNSFQLQLNIQYIFQSDLGYRVASARNKGILAARGKICVFVDSGVILDEDCISAHIKFHLSGGPRVAGIGYIFGFEENDHLTDNLIQLVDPEHPRKSIERLLANEVFFDVREEHYTRYNDQICELAAPWQWFWTSHISVSRENLLRVSLFDEKYDLRWGVEDNDLGFRLHHNGIKIHILREAKSIHYPHSKNKEARHQEGYHNCQYFHKKFNTLETMLFLDTYLQTELVDINRLSLQFRKEEPEGKFVVLSI